MWNGFENVAKSFGIDVREFQKTIISHKPKKGIPRGVTLPTSFNARSQWPTCIHSIRDQGGCGSCWAFSSAAILEDRFCIHSNGAINVRLSPQDMVNCDFSNGGCNGGYLTPSVSYLMAEGLVSEECLPYTEESGICTYQCADSSIEYRKYACKAGSTAIPTSADDIKYELMTNGPMMVGFTIYSDFMVYANGIYEHITGGSEGGHAVKLIGWEYNGGRLVWICQNQWGDSWGELGDFRIYAGEAGIDSAAFACMPDI